MILGCRTSLIETTFVAERLQKELEKEVDKMLKLGVIEPSQIEWYSLIVLASKPNNVRRFVMQQVSLYANSAAI